MFQYQFRQLSYPPNMYSIIIGLGKVCLVNFASGLLEFEVLLAWTPGVCNQNTFDEQKLLTDLNLFQIESLVLKHQALVQNNSRLLNSFKCLTTNFNQIKLKNQGTQNLSLKNKNQQLKERNRKLQELVNTYQTTIGQSKLFMSKYASKKEVEKNRIKQKNKSILIKIKSNSRNKYYKQIDKQNSFKQRFQQNRNKTDRVYLNNKKIP